MMLNHPNIFRALLQGVTNGLQAGGNQKESLPLCLLSLHLLSLS
jgi:hypothetical protein